MCGIGAPLLRRRQHSLLLRCWGRERFLLRVYVVRYCDRLKCRCVDALFDIPFVMVNDSNLTFVGVISARVLCPFILITIPFRNFTFNRTFVIIMLVVMLRVINGYVSIRFMGNLTCYRTVFFCQVMGRLAIIIAYKDNREYGGGDDKWGRRFWKCFYFRNCFDFGLCFRLSASMSILHYGLACWFSVCTFLKIGCCRVIGYKY